MKKIFFIDDLETVLKPQLDEMQKILADNHDVEAASVLCNMTNVMDCLDDNGQKANIGDPSYQEIHQTLDDILEQINESLVSCDKVEIVIDLTLSNEYNSKLGYRLAKYILTNMNNPSAFTSQQLLITFTSSYISADFSQLCGNILTPEERELIVECYRPFFPAGRDENYVIDKKMTAFPEFYYDYRCEGDDIPAAINKLLLDQDNAPGSKGTCYGNYFGLIYARLYKRTEKITINGH